MDRVILGLLIAVVAFSSAFADDSDVLDKLNACEPAEDYCGDNQKVIACLEKIGPVKDHEKFLLDEHLRYYRELKQNSCPALKSKGSCLRKEISKCETSAPEDADEKTRCKGIVSCYRALRQNCPKNGNNTDELDYVLAEADEFDCEKGIFKNGGDGGDDGNGGDGGDDGDENSTEAPCKANDIACKARKEAMKCVNEKIDECIKDFEFVDVDEKQCQKGPEVLLCLRGVAAKCPKLGEEDSLIQSQTEMVETILLDCQNGIFSGKCSYKNLRNCIDPIYEIEHADNLEEPLCTAEMKTKAINCVDAIKPSCTKQQMSSYKDAIEEINDCVSAPESPVIG